MLRGHRGYQLAAVANKIRQLQDSIPSIDHGVHLSGCTIVREQRNIARPGAIRYVSGVTVCSDDRNVRTQYIRLLVRVSRRANATVQTNPLA